MKRYALLFCTVSAGTLVGCSQLTALLSPADAPATASGTRAVPPSRTTVSRSSGGVINDQQNLFAQAREAQGRRDLALAEKLFNQLLALNPRHVGALNGLGVVYAQGGRLDAASDLFRRALELEPKAAHIYNNQGYAALLGGHLNEAESALQRARALDPSSELIAKNLGLLADAKARSSAPEAASAPPVGSTLVVVAPNVYELRDPAPRVGAGGPPPSALANPGVAKGANGRDISVAVQRSLPSSLLPVAVAHPTLKPEALRGVKLEVSNGVGIRHMAHRTAERLAPTGVIAARLTNQPRYDRLTTEIQFAPGQAAAADALSAQLPLAPSIKPVKSLERNIQVRLVLGRDLVGRAIAAWLDEVDGSAVVLNHENGWLWG